MKNVNSIRDSREQKIWAGKWQECTTCTLEGELEEEREVWSGGTEAGSNGEVAGPE